MQSRQNMQIHSRTHVMALEQVLVDEVHSAGGFHPRQKRPSRAASAAAKVDSTRGETRGLYLAASISGKCRAQSTKQDRARMSTIALLCSVTECYRHLCVKSAHPLHRVDATNSLSLPERPDLRASSSTEESLGQFYSAAQLNLMFSVDASGLGLRLSAVGRRKNSR